MAGHQATGYPCLTNNHSKSGLGGMHHTPEAKIADVANRLAGLPALDELIVIDGLALRLLVIQLGLR